MVADYLNMITGPVENRRSATMTQTLGTISLGSALSDRFNAHAWAIAVYSQRSLAS